MRLVWLGSVRRQTDTQNDSKINLTATTLKAPVKTVVFDRITHYRVPGCHR